MKPIMQTNITPEEGNCFSACIATVLEIDISEVPNVRNDFAWFQIMDKFVSKYGYGLLHMLRIDYVREDAGEWRKKAYIIATGNSPRHEDLTHSVVYQNDEMVHDPHPDGGGLDEKPGYYIIFVALDAKVDK